MYKYENLFDKNSDTLPLTLQCKKMPLPNTSINFENS